MVVMRVLVMVMVVSVHLFWKERKEEMRWAPRTKSLSCLMHTARAHCATKPPFPSKNHSLRSFVENLWKFICLISFLGNHHFHHRYQLPITNITPHHTKRKLPISTNTTAIPDHSTKAATTLSRNALFVLCELVPLILFWVSLKSHCWALSGGKQWQIG